MSDDGEARDADGGAVTPAPGGDGADVGATGDGRRPRRGGAGRAVALIVAGLVVPAVGLLVLMRSCARTAVSGEVAVSGDHGWREPLNRCRAGELLGFDGVELARERDGKVLVRAMVDVDHGPQVELFPPSGGLPLRLDGARCPGLRVELRRVGEDHDGAAILDGRVVARCAADGGTISLDAWWRGCGPG